ncbi:hypothetical protein ACSQ67_001156 [Phaseolus vulgaris]
MHCTNPRLRKKKVAFIAVCHEPLPTCLTFIAKKFAQLDVDSYAILMEGWEGEGDKGVVVAKETFAKMVIEIGWGMLMLVEVGRVLQPSIEMFNLMIALLCYYGDTDAVRKMLDEMVYRGHYDVVKSQADP